jgi:hypothetical protein
VNWKAAYDVRAVWRKLWVSFARGEGVKGGRLLRRCGTALLRNGAVVVGVEY